MRINKIIKPKIIFSPKRYLYKAKKSEPFGSNFFALYKYRLGEKIILGFIILLILIALLSVFLSRNHFSNEKIIKQKGKYGEFYVSQILGNSIDGIKQVFNDYKFISNGKSVQIDHIYINKNGIFVIETKNYKGSIYGNEEQQEWTQVLAYGNVKNKFYNPIKQNNSHIYKLQKFLPKNIDIISIVVFIDADIENVDSNNVCNVDELNEILNMNYGKTISPKQVDYVANILRRYQNNNITDEEHINNIHKMQEDIENNICPRCGAKLVLRDSEYGNFWGCPKYPNCKFKKKL
jgi:hypothetical protein